ISIIQEVYLSAMDINSLSFASSWIEGNVSIQYIFLSKIFFPLNFLSTCFSILASTFAAYTAIIDSKSEIHFCYEDANWVTVAIHATFIFLLLMPHVLQKIVHILRTIELNSYLRRQPQFLALDFITKSRLQKQQQ